VNQIKKYNSIIIIFISILIILACEDSEGITEQNDNSALNIVEKYGQLSINGSNLVDKSGEVIVLRGMSLFWSQWGGVYYNEETISWLRDDWKCTVIRASMGIEPDGYIENPELEYGKITTVIDVCLKLGIYVIIDWHDHNAENHKEQAVNFFKKISEDYGEYPNIIYEIYNEPLNVSWSNVIKPYAESVIEAIRVNDSDNIIIVGTPNWSQDVESVINNTIADDNVMYSFHFYTSTHKEWLRNKCDLAIAANIPIFVSEWGLSEASGNGDIDFAESNLWTNYLEENNLSWCNWSIMNKDETSAAILSSTSTLSNWENNQLSLSGNTIRDYLIRINSDLFD